MIFMNTDAAKKHLSPDKDLVTNLLEIIFSCDQAPLWMVPSVCHTFLAATKQLYEWFSPYIRLSICHTFFTMFQSSYHHEIFRSYYQSWQK